MEYPKIKSLPHIPSKKEYLKDIPETSGIYVFWKGSEIIYIGKAINLKSRLESYFSINLAPKTRNMVGESTHISLIKVTSELEALLLEARLIKDYQPKYNFISKDDKHALYIKITKEKYPRVVTARKVDEEGSLSFFGPFPSSTKVYSVLRFLRKNFPYSDHKIGKRPCIYSQIGLCSPCPNQIERIEDVELKTLETSKYKRNIRMIKKILNGDINKVVSDLQKEMDVYSKEEKYEEAAKVKREIESLIYITQNVVSENLFLENPNLSSDLREKEIKDLQGIIFDTLGVKKDIKRIECFDISHISGYLPTASMVTFIDGEADKRFYRKFKVRVNKNSDTESLSEIAGRRIKNMEAWGKPDLILVDGGKGQVGAFNKEFSRLDITIIGIAKRYETLVFLKNGKFIEYRLHRSVALNLVQRIRDESHRFAKKYHNLLFKKNLLSME